MDEHQLSLTGGEALARMLKLSRIEFMFGMGGFQLLPFYDAIARDDDIQFQHILVSDERSGAFAADACARVSGKPGLCDGTMGPGATNLTNGLIESYHAGIPIVAVVGDSNRLHSWKNMTQETRQREVLSPIVKEYITVEAGTRIPELVRRAFVTATSGRPGPVVLCVPETVSYGDWEFDEADFFIPNHALKTPSFRIAPDPVEVAKAAGLIKMAERPLLLVGGGIHLSGAYTELERFATDLNIPVAYTLSGKGCLSGNHPLCVHLFGRWNRIANELIHESDLLIGLGFKFGEISTNRYTIFSKHTPLVHIDITPEEIGRHQPVVVGLWADCRLALTALLEELGPSISAQKQLRKEYVTSLKEMLAQWRQANQARLTSNETPINMSRVCYELSRAMPAGGILLADGGFAAHWTGLLYDNPTAGRTFVANRGNASIGYGIPGGIGAQLAAGKSEPVAAITGDGGCNMSLGDLEILVQKNIPLTLMVVNNAASGYVKALQHSIYGNVQIN